MKSIYSSPIETPPDDIAPKFAALVSGLDLVIPQVRTVSTWGAVQIAAVIRRPTVRGAIGKLQHLRITAAHVAKRLRGERHIEIADTIDALVRASEPQAIANARKDGVRR